MSTIADATRRAMRVALASHGCGDALADLLDVTAGTVAASRALVPDSNRDLATLGALTADDTFNVAITTGTTGYYGVRAITTFSLATAGVHKAISGEVLYTPATTGFATSIGVAGKATLNAKGMSGGTGYMWGVQGQLDFAAGSTYASSQLAAGRFVMTEAGAVTYTSGNIACIYADNLITSPLADECSGDCDLIRIANHGGKLDHAINVYGPNVTYLFNLNGCATAGCVSAGTANDVHGGTGKRVKINIDGTSYYFLASTTPT